MKCPSCGKEIAEDCKFCVYCGAQVKKNSKPLLITLFVVIGLLALGGFGYYQYENRAEPKPKGYARTHGSSNGYDWVDLGLSVKWATCNVGATTPEGYGDYFAWGETSTKTEYTEDNSKTSGNSMGDISGNASYDAARANWGGTWRLPTKTECQELVDRCKWKRTTQNGVNGYKVTGPNGNSIFLPAAGYRYDGSSLYKEEADGSYWNSTPYEGHSCSYSGACGFSFFRKGYGIFYGGSRDYGRSVRPVVE